MPAFWLTFKPRSPSAPQGWPIEELSRLIARFEADPATGTEWWRIASHATARVGDRVYLFKQGDDPRGIFGTGTILDGPDYRATGTDDEGPRHRALISFERLVDPTVGFLLPLEAIADIVPGQLINAMASGYSVPDSVASEIEYRLAGRRAVPAGAVGEHWTVPEVEAVVSAYFAMLRLETDGLPYAKTIFNVEVREATGRSKGSVEFKFANVSAVLDDMGLLWIDGYKPRGHGQIGAIQDAIDAYLENHQGFAARLEPVRETVPALPPALSDVFTVPPPKTEPKAPTGFGKVMPKRDRAASDARNRRLGEQGEEYVFKLEQRRLTVEGRSDLAGEVAWTARDEGDGAGYDIASFNSDGSRRLIEVKTTNGGPETPFYVTVNEVSVSDENAATFWLYRVYEFSKEPRIYCLKVSLKSGELKLAPSVYRASR